MKRKNLKWAMFFVGPFSLFLSSCGVKGVPQTPLNPIPIGRGEISKPRQIKPSKKINKYQYNKSESVEEDDEDGN